MIASPGIPVLHALSGFDVKTRSYLIAPCRLTTKTEMSLGHGCGQWGCFRPMSSISGSWLDARLTYLSNRSRKLDITPSPVLGHASTPFVRQALGILRRDLSLTIFQRLEDHYGDMPVCTLPINLVATVISNEARPQALTLFEGRLPSPYLPYFRP